jgi:hypothetical protein
MPPYPLGGTSTPNSRRSSAVYRTGSLCHDRTRGLQQRAWLLDHFVSAQQDRLGEREPSAFAVFFRLTNQRRVASARTSAAHHEPAGLQR